MKKRSFSLNLKGSIPTSDSVSGSERVQAKAPSLSSVDMGSDRGFELFREAGRLKKRKVECMHHETRKIYLNTNPLGGLDPKVAHAYMSGRSGSKPEDSAAEEQLLQSQRLEALGTLVGGIAHDFNNILNVITGHITLMERWRTDPERFVKSLEAVRKATERGASTARQLLTFSRKVEVVTEQVRIGDVIKELVELLREIFPEKISFSVDIEPDMPMIPADSNRIHQALLNLCVNARDAMPDNGTIGIAAETISGEIVKKRFKEAEADRYVEVSVSDSGSGIDEETLARVFEPFFTTKKNGRGTGLGLSVVSWIMEAHGGFIDVESQIGHGTTFFLLFPVVPQPIRTTAKEKDLNELPRGHGEVVLAIEDEEPLRDFLSLILEECGYKVLLAPDGAEGLKTYMQHLNAVSLVLLDMGLPGMSGAEVLAQLVLLNPHVKVITASGYVQPEIRADALEIGAIGFLSKPYHADQLLTKIYHALRRTVDSAEG